MGSKYPISVTETDDVPHILLSLLFTYFFSNSVPAFFTFQNNYFL